MASDAGGEDDLVIEIPDDEVALDGSGAPASTDDAAAALDARKEQSAKRERARDDDAGEERRRAEADRRRLEDELAAARQEAQEARSMYDGEARARTAAEEQATLRTEQAMRAHWQKINADHGQISSAITSAEAESLAAERDLIRAQEEGDTSAAAAAQRAMARAESALVQLRAGEAEAKRQIERTRAVFEDHYRAQQQQPQADRRPDPAPPAPQKEMTADDWIREAEKKIGRDGARWLRDNKDYVTDPKKNRTFLRFAAQYVDDNGEDALGSRDFLDAIEERFGEAGRDADPDPKPERPARRRAATAAPVSRGNSVFNSGNLDARRVRLPPALAAHVKSMGLDPVKYALQAVEDIKAGRLDKRFLDPDYPHDF